MAWGNKEVTMDILEGFDYIIEEGQNTTINLRKISWNDKPHKLDLRKWTYNENGERAMKGVTLSDEGGDELSAVLVENGYGDTKRIIRAIKKRDDYEEASKLADAPDNDKYEDDGSEEYYNPSELLGEY